MVYEQWSYRRPILITENSGSDLSDYAVKIVLNSSNFDSWDKVNPDGSDIRFTDDQGNPLSYWIEKFDSVNQEAIIWVKIPILQANSQITIYMYYGNPNAVSEANGDDVFSFFDDFNDLSKWRIVRIGGSGYAKAEDGYLKLKSTEDFTTVDTEFTLNHHTIEAKVYAVSASAPFVIATTQGEYDTRGHLINGYYIAMNADMDTAPKNKISKRVNGTTTDLATTTQNLLQNGQTYLIGFVFSTPILKLLLNNNVLIETTDNTFTQLPYLAILVFSPAEYWIDWIRVRKYTDPEPSVTIMSEEYIGITISVYDSLLVQNAYVSIQRVLETSILVSDSLLVQNAEISISKLLEPSILVSDSLLVKNANISISKLLEPSILVSDSLLVKNAEVSLVRTLEPSILVSNALLVKNASVSMLRVLEPIISVSDSLLVQNASVSILRLLAETSILVADSLLVKNAEISLIRALEPSILVSDLIAVKSAEVSISKLLEPTILVSDSLLVKNANIDLIRALEPTILVSNSLLVKNASISISRSLEPVISVSDSLLVQNAYLKLIREISPSILVSDSLLINNAYIQMLASSEPFITVRDSLLIQNADINLQRLLETIISISGLWAVRNATITLQRTKEVVTKPTEVPYKELLLFGSVLGALYLLSKKKEEEVRYG